MDEDVVTMEQIAKDEDDLFDEANAVLGNADVNTWNAGVCLACSINCHDGHELVEIYTKRHFRCDCGNKKFPRSNECQLLHCKPTQNDENQYNQNFSGLYCSCSRPYPDPERSPGSEEVMLQCIMCEDWFHEEHLKLSAKESASALRQCTEIICGSCMDKHSFLSFYLDHQEELNDCQGEPCVLKFLKSKSTERKNQDEVGCWMSAWRHFLCKCMNCMSMYKKDHIEYLVDPSDPLYVYESQPKASTESSMELGAKALQSQLSHTQQIEMALGYRDLSTQLRDYLDSFAKENKVVSKRDIEDFFYQFKEEKKNQKRQRIS